MIQKKHSHHDLNTSGYVELTDEHKGVGQLRVEGIGPSRWVEDPPRPSGYGYSYRSGHQEWDQWRVVGTAMPDGWPMAFGLRRYPEGFVLPASLAGATVYPTKAEAVALAEEWLAKGGPGLGLEHPDDTVARKRAERSGYNYGKAAHYLSSLTDEDLVKLSEAALKVVAKRAETAVARAARDAEKRRKAAEKAQLAADKAAAKAAKAAAKAVKDAEKARKQAERAAKQAAKAVPAPEASPA